MNERKRERPDDYFKDWKEREALAEGMIPLVGELSRRKNVKCYIYGKSLVNQSVTQIMKDHRYVRQVEENELSEFETFPIIKSLSALDLGPAHIDIGRLAVQYYDKGEGAGLSVDDYVRQEVADLIGARPEPGHAPVDVVLYGFGRIGRLMARILIDKTDGGESLRLRAVVVRKGSAPDDLVKRASLLRRDSVHGAFDGTIRVDEERQSFVANGNEVKVIYADSPDSIDYTEYGINNAIVVDNTGVWRDQEGLSRHLQSKGVAKVILTAPGKGDMKNVVAGINNDMIDAADTIISAASCTTNAIVPPLKAMDDRYGIISGHVETVHAYTNDQNLIDNYHKADRRGRSAPLNMVITETGAAKAVAKVLPQLAGKLTGNAIRVPIPNVSMAILNLTLGRATTKEEVNEYMRHMALHSTMRKQIDYSNSPEVVSSDFVGSRHACIFDAQATIVNGTQAVLYLWYDNEFGYSCQVYRILEQVSGIRYARYPRNS
ncbi:MAG TPA: glyceraldehyde-3-phosphate dehydrogenase [Halieaceae bacterium]|nr:MULTISPECIES: glyceraldehyde-3-phosphate dehydrogenase [Haliea]HAN68181.1 glyceraldehyde-3-phosphate dehydrogenase [Halieaceae bacterium]MAY94758.1 aldehyde dehydrogenase [Haliea sp.]MBP71762.1 aldehyde dehydrogenase [Haliea sp.]HBQ39965.1 glyceraldehyde-3-phosphate dehydrogenase [Halieaceae bacterium]HBX71724.1 glyceraldehyde-3-phosphate dehydrogenase [Halieaceae bacterium]